MPVFSVVGKEPFPKVLVAKNTIKGVVDTSIRKLKLPPGSYKPESELVILPEDEEWEMSRSTSGQETPRSTSGQETPRSTSVTPNITMRPPSFGVTRTSQGLRSNDISVPWVSLACVEEEFGCRSPLKPRTLRAVVHVLANHLVSKNDFSRTSCNTIAKEVFIKYPDSFTIKDVDGNVLSDGYWLLLVSYLVPPELKRRRGAKRQLIEDEDGDFEHELNPRYDSYGCVAWQPRIPEGESRESQERMWGMAALDLSPDILPDLYEKTYWYRRTDINNRKGSLEEVLLLWPALKQTSFFLCHCAKLLSKDCREVWFESLQSQGHNLFKYLEDFATTTKETNHNRGQLHALQQLAAEGQSAVKETRARTPLITAMILMVISYFSDKRDTIMRLVDIDIPIDEVCSVDRPILLVKGRSLFDESAEVLVACEGNIILRPNSLMEGLMSHFLSLFFKLNPTNGHKRGPKSTRVVF
ncbi:DNA excision repair protein ERCC-6-like 2 [Frankliniella fusca]|uniref:DNA excision repair protein ERCC-6-like 2 n=1 Tax=Frankliniella fusca TaxID=407009 RepID=A0AAE1HY99_9NEOP|nr:DNA excision repair protein ERCC-6-like 2 [Frankliniella fusca]